MEIKYRQLNQVRVLELIGRLDMASVPLARQWLDDATSQQPAHVVINMSKVSFLDSSGLSALVQGLNRSREMDGDLRLCGLQTPVRMIFELTRFDRIFEIFVSEDDAIAAFIQS
jgi:anti-sigma B factor antagonist